MRVRGRWHLAIAGVVALATVVVFVPVLRHGFVNYDDPEYVTENVHVRAGLSWAGVPWAFTAPHAADWHPLTWLSHVLDAQLFGLAPAGHHATSVLLHATTAALPFEVLAGITGTPWRSAFVAAVFALHPLRVESVAWVSERKDVLGAFYWVLTMLAYAWYAQRPGLGRYLAVVVAFVLGLLSKPMLVTLPCALVLLDYWPLCRFGAAVATDEGPPFARASLPRLLLEKLPLLALSAVASAVTIYAQKIKVDPLLEELSLPLRVLNAALAYVGYVAQ